MAALFRTAQKWGQPRCLVIDGWINKMVSYYYGILFGHKKKWRINRCYTIDRPWEHYAKWNKQATKAHIYVVPWTWNAQKDRFIRQKVHSWCRVWEEQEWLVMRAGCIFKVMEMFWKFHGGGGCPTSGIHCKLTELDVLNCWIIVCDIS